MVAAAPPLASVALNTSVLYVGQATGSFVGGLFYARELLQASDLSQWPSRRWL